MQFVKGDRETAPTCRKVELKCCGKELIESPFTMLSLIAKAQCGLNLSNAQQPVSPLGTAQTVNVKCR